MDLIKYSLKHNINSIPIIQLLICLILSPSFNILDFDYKRIFQLTTISYILLNSFLTYPHHNFFNNLNNFQKLKTSIFIILGITTAFLAKQSNYAFMELSLYIGLFYMFLTLGKISQKNPPLVQQFFFGTLTLAALLYQTNFFYCFSCLIYRKYPFTMA